MRLGVCYYPEQWPQARWSADARAMRQLGIDLVRIGEFAWSKMEPAEGRFEWDWLDAAIETLASAGHAVVLGTPTAAPPAWLSRTYPDTLPVDENGRRRNFGGRRHYCPNATMYQHLTDRIVRALAGRYGDSTAVVGWQIDNEFGGGRSARCYCEYCISAFRGWLGRRYGTLEELNRAWGTPFWSQTYSAWDQIGAPNGTISAANPSQLLDYQRFSSASWTAYQKRQIEVLRKHADLARQFITHNTMGLFFTEIDYYQLAADLDFVSLDNYPTGGIDRIRELLYLEETPASDLAPDAGDPALTGLELDLARSLKGKPFWIMEQQPGQINWSKYNVGIRPELVRLWSWQAAAKGAETIVFFRWRASLMAQEQYHDGILQHDGSPSTGHQALTLLRTDWQRLEAFTAAPPSAEVALLFDYESMWAIQIQPQRSGLQYLTHLFRIYRALQGLAIQSDIVPKTADLSKYSLVIAPMLHIGDQSAAHRMQAYAENGGTLVLTIRSGFKMPSNLVTEAKLPGVYRRMAGMRVEKWFGLAPEVRYGLESKIDGLAGEAGIWAEMLSLEGAAALARYTTGPFAGQAALTENRVGSGKVLYLGWQPSVLQVQALLASLSQEAGVPRSAANLDPGLVVQRRGTQTLLLNFSEIPRTARLGERQEVIVPPLDLVIVDHP